MKKLWLLVPSALLVGVVVVLARPGPPSELSEPPPLVLAIGGVEQQGERGTYCWMTRRGSWGRGICADAQGPITPDKPLVAASPFTATVRLPSNQPDSLVLRVMPVSPEDELETTASGKRIWRHTGEDIQQRYDLARQAAPTLELDLEPGLYVLWASARWSGGSAAIGWLVESQSPGGN